MTFYLGRPGALATLKHPLRGITPTITRPVTITTLLSGAKSVQRGPDGRRTYELAWKALTHTDYSILEEFYLGGRGAGPFILIDPGRSNILSLNQSTSTTAGPANSTDGFSVAGTGESLSSASTPVYRTGGRSLAWALPNIVSGGVLVFAAPATLTQIPVLASTAYAAQIRVRLAATTPAVSLTLQLVWLDSAGATISTTASTPTSGSSSTWTQITATATSPATAVYVRMQVTAAVTAVATDTFTRTSSSGLGTADVGGTWTDSGGAATDYTVGSGAGSHSMSATGSARRSTLAVSAADLETLVTVTVPVVALTQDIRAELIARYVDANNFLYAEARFAPAGALTVAVVKCIAGVFTTVATATPTTGTYSAASSWKLRFRVVGSSLRARLWPALGTEPSTWDIDATDAALTSAGGVGLRSTLIAGNTNTLPVALAYDNFAAGYSSTVYIDTPGLHMASTVPTWTLGTGIPLVTVTALTDTYKILPRHDGAWTLTEVG